MSAVGGIAIEVGAPGSSETRLFVPGTGKIEWFTDLDVGPELVVIPAGSFLMGSPESDERRENEGPPRKVIFAKPFAAGRFAVTFDEWDACASDGGCNGYEPEDEGWGRGRRPVINVSWDDAKAYVNWLAKKTGKPYRLLSEAEWEYAARAGSTTAFWWGNSISPHQANYGSISADVFSFLSPKPPTGKTPQHTLVVNSFEPNPWGLYQVHGNVWEWTQDCYNDNYNSAPTDGSAWISGDCVSRVARGGSWVDIPGLLRSASRTGGPSATRGRGIGFRVARTLVAP
jgi:formylglycine-generating enzyme required for sulfatase activity